VALMPGLFDHGRNVHDAQILHELCLAYEQYLHLIFPLAKIVTRIYTLSKGALWYRK
jgi:hypothetical protein